MWSQFLTWVRYVLLLRWPYAGEAYLFSLVTTGCVNSRGGKSRHEGKLLPGFIVTLITTCGSGIVAPVLLRDPPLFFNDDRLCTCILIFYLLSIRFDPYLTNFIKQPILWKAMTMLSTCSRMNKIAFMVDYAASRLPSSHYYPIAIFGPILAGFLRGIGGSLLPCDKGLSPLRKGLSFKYQLSLFVAVFYHIVANDHYLIGGLVRGFLRLEELSREDVRLMVVIFGVTFTAVQLFVASEFNPFTPAHEVMYAVTGMPRAPCATKKTNGSITATDNAPISGSNGSSNGSGDSNGNGDRAGDGDADRVAGGAMGGEETEAKRRALYDLKSRQRMQFMMDALKPVLVVAVAVLYFYSAQPPSHLSAGQFMTISDGGLSACTFLPEPVRLGCKPLRATVSESGSLVVFQGDLKAEVPMGKEGQGGVLFVSRSPRWKKFEPEELRLELTHDGLLVVMAGPQMLWSSSLTPLGKRLPPYRVEARLDPVKGALEVYKGGNLQWSSAGRV